MQQYVDIDATHRRKGTRRHEDLCSLSLNVNENFTCLRCLYGGVWGKRLSRSGDGGERDEDSTNLPFDRLFVPSVIFNHSGPILCMAHGTPRLVLYF